MRNTINLIMALLIANRVFFLRNVSVNLYLLNRLFKIIRKKVDFCVFESLVFEFWSKGKHYLSFMCESSIK